MSAMLAHQQAGFDPRPMSLTCTGITPRRPHCQAGLSCHGRGAPGCMKLNNSAFPYLVQCSEFLQHVPTAMNRDSQDTPEVRV
jgi:hypothetical protein